MLYAYRWQVELFFRCIKRTLNALHLWNHEPDGIKIQFYIYLIVYVLLIDFKQTLIQENENQTINRQTSIDSSSSPKESPLQKKEIPGCQGMVWFLCWAQNLKSYGNFLFTG